MKPVGFKEQTTLFAKPKSMMEGECGTLPAHIDLLKNITTSCWEFSDEEIEVIKKTKKIWLTTFAVPPPPVTLQVNSPFEKVNKSASIDEFLTEENKK